MMTPILWTGDPIQPHATSTNDSHASVGPSHRPRHKRRTPTPDEDRPAHIHKSGSTKEEIVREEIPPARSLDQNNAAAIDGYRMLQFVDRTVLWRVPLSWHLVGTPSDSALLNAEF